jgi:hypothetical protein
LKSQSYSKPAVPSFDGSKRNHEGNATGDHNTHPLEDVQIVSKCEILSMQAKMDDRATPMLGHADHSGKLIEC